MYLTKLNQETGLLLIEDNQDGILAIKEFRNILNSPEHGLGCLTAVALVVDYQSSIKYYSDKDRPRKAMEEVTGNRNEWEWNVDIIQLALKKYDALQFDPTLEEGRIYYEQKVRKLGEIQTWDSLSDDSPSRVGRTMASLKKDLRAINEDIQLYEKRILDKDIYSNSPVVNGYTLSRLEQKLEKSHSFYNTIR
jgi:hypothetical protein